MIPLILPIFLLPLGLAAWLIVRGLHGFRVGDHPICRKCGFDLYGCPAGTRVCGECGYSLDLPGRVVIGHHHRRTSFIWAGGIIAAPFLFAMTVSMLGAVQGSNWLRYAPASLLDRMASSASQSTRQPALAELNSRWASGSLNSQELLSVVETGLSYQAGGFEQAMGHGLG